MMHSLGRALLLVAVLLAAVGRAPAPAQGAAGADFPYALDAAGEAAWIGGDLAVWGASLYLDRLKSAGDASSLDASSIPAFDRLYTTTHSPALGTAADALVVAAALVPAAALPGLSRSQAFSTGLMLAETLGAAYSLDAVIKSVVTRYRPYAYSSPPPSDIGSGEIASSFPSRHATLAFAAAVFAGTVFDSTHPYSPYSGIVWGGSLGLATAIGALRMASGEHFLSDVAAGAALGAVIGYTVPRLHRMKGKADVELSASPDALIVTLRL